MSGWVVERHGGEAAFLHALPPPDPWERTVRVLESDGPALVLGSTQADDVVDRAATTRRGVAVVRRRSGGGAVLVEPGSTVWLDVLVPAGDPLWSDDVGRAFWWLGDVWAEALGSLGLDAAVHHGGLCTTEWSRLVCFGGLGPGEVVVGGRKALGLAQRRERWGARFQCAVNRVWSARATVDLLRLTDGERAASAAALDASVASVDRPAPELVDAFLAHLPA